MDFENSNCEKCSLVNYGLDCQNNPVNLEAVPSYCPIRKDYEQTYDIKED